MRKIIYIFIWAMGCIGCQDYLSINPDSSLEVKIDSEEKIAELLTAAYPTASYCSFLEARTDNVAERIKGEHTRLNEAMYFWEDYDQEDLDTPLNYWNACYTGIAQANKALELLAAYPKTERVKALYAEAFLLRAYLHFMLVNIWAEPYGTHKSAQSPGIPYLTKPEKNALVNYSRGTVKEVYEKIETDLKLGITLVNDNFYANPKFHFNQKAAYAFASRFYLMKGEWQQVIAYADYVLGYTPQKLLRKWGDGYRVNRALASSYAASSEPANLLLVTTESRLAREVNKQKYGSTIDIINHIYDTRGIDGCSGYTKLKMQVFFPFVQSPGNILDGYYMPKFSELSLLGASGTKPRGVYVTNVLLTADEVMLNRMEAYAMTGQYDRAVTDLQDYLQAKFSMELPCVRQDYTWTNSNNYAIYTPFYGLTIKQLALLKTITDFRQKEFLHEGLRWFDIRRFYLPVTRTSKSSLYRPLEKEDLRKVLQIPVEAINRGLQPNPR